MRTLRPSYNHNTVRVREVPCLCTKVQLRVVVVDFVWRIINSWRRYEGCIGRRPCTAGAGQLAVEVRVGIHCAICRGKAACRVSSAGLQGAIYGSGLAEIPVQESQACAYQALLTSVAQQ